MKERTLRSLVVALNVGWKQLVAHHDVHDVWLVIFMLYLISDAKIKGSEL